MKLIIAGTITFIHETYIFRTLNILFALRGLHNIEITLCGECEGPDKIGKKWAIENNIPVKSYEADWNKYGKAAGPIRNEEMAKDATHAVIFYDGKSRGSKNMIELCKKYKLKYCVVNYITHEMEFEDGRIMMNGATRT